MLIEHEPCEKLTGTYVSIGSNSYSFAYDNNGNLITENTDRHFEWDYADQMRSFYVQVKTDEPSVYTQYLYAGGTRLKKITRKSSGDKYVTIYIDGIFEHSYHLDGSNTMDEELNELHILDEQTRVAMLRTGYDDGTPFTKYILSDHLGSSNVILETDGSVYNREEYYPFGETSFGSFGKKRYRYVGKEKDEESGLYYYGARYYASWTCRFISVDPLALKYNYQSSYAYADDNPINKMDHNGEGTGDPPAGNPQKSSTTTNGGTQPPTAGQKFNINHLTLGTTNQSDLNQAALNDNAKGLNEFRLKQTNLTPVPATPKPPLPTKLPAGSANAQTTQQDNTAQTTQQAELNAAKPRLYYENVLRNTKYLSADTRNNFQRKVDAARTEDLNFSWLTTHTPIAGNAWMAGRYNAWGMSEQRNAELTKTGIGVGMVAVPVVAGAALEAGVATSATRVFWSGGRLAQQEAWTFAGTNEMATLEMTASGRFMSAVNPYLPRFVSRPAWSFISREFASGASGEAHFITTAAGPSPTSIWMTVEKPILDQNLVRIISHTP